jgi:hypothetical protein
MDTKNRMENKFVDYYEPPWFWAFSAAYVLEVWDGLSRGHLLFGNIQSNKSGRFVSYTRSILSGEKQITDVMLACIAN